MGCGGSGGRGHRAGATTPQLFQGFSSRISSPPPQGHRGRPGALGEPGKQGAQVSFSSRIQQDSSGIPAGSRWGCPCRAGPKEGVLGREREKREGGKRKMGNQGRAGRPSHGVPMPWAVPPVPIPVPRGALSPQSLKNSLFFHSQGPKGDVGASGEQGVPGPPVNPSFLFFQLPQDLGVASLSLSPHQRGDTGDFSTGN